MHIFADVSDDREWKACPTNLEIGKFRDGASVGVKIVTTIDNVVVYDPWFFYKEVSEFFNYAGK